VTFDFTKKITHQYKFLVRGLSINSLMMLIGGVIFLSILAISAIQRQSFQEQAKISRHLTDLSRAFSYHQDADMMHDALRSDVLLSLLKNKIYTEEAALMLVVRADAKQFRDDLSEMNKLILPVNIMQSNTHVNSLAGEYIDTALELVELSQIDLESAMSRFPEFQKLFESLLVVMREQTELLENEQGKFTLNQDKGMVNEMIRVLGAEIVITAFAITLVWLMFGWMRKSLGDVSRVAHAISKGALNMRCGINTRDEVGQLASSVNAMANSLETMILQLKQEAERDSFGKQLGQAFDMSDSEPDAYEVTSRAMAMISSGHSMELLLSDSSRAHLECAVEHPEQGSPECPVDTPYGCAAVRRGKMTVFNDSESLNACPHLRGRSTGPLSAVCIPVSFMGRSLGVLHTTGKQYENLSDDQLERLKTLATQAGSHIGTVRAFSRTQLQATTDRLTGLRNRAQLEDKAGSLILEGRPFAMILADLDHFKSLNDGYGHLTGDQALVLYAKSLQACSRDDDWVGRWGGEEFAVILANVTARQAMDFVDRMRAHLASAIHGAGVPDFTCSYGVADSTMSDKFDTIVRLADIALYTSKNGGRDRGTIADPVQSYATPLRQKSEHQSKVDVGALVRVVG
jgi:diguanylate cyclase (GGDEF)-like protein